MDSAAKLADGNCDLEDGSEEGDWRLPTKEEWEEVVDDEDYSFDVLEDAFSAVLTYYYWSSTTFATVTDYAWGVYLGDGNVDYDDKAITYYFVWPVRGGE